MKPIYKLILLLSLISLIGKSQILSESFNATMPAGWTPTPSINWMIDSNLGVSGSGCIYTQEPGSSSLVSTLITPTLNISAVTNLTVTFNLALVGNNFVVPDMSLLYDDSSGPQFLARWGSGVSSNPTNYTLSTNNYDYQPPLDTQNVTWVTCTQTVPSIPGSIVRFLFKAEIVNGGYVLLDDVVINSKNILTTRLRTEEKYEEVFLFPNPCPGKKLILKGKEITNIFITDALGKNQSINCQDKNEHGIGIDLGYLPNGIYYLNAMSDEKLISKKVILE